MNLEWIKNIDEKTISYLESLKSSSEDPEYFPVLENITEQGEKIKLGFSCFALKIIFILNQLENYDLKNWTSYLNSYQNNIKGFPDNSFIDNNYLHYSRKFEVDKFTKDQIKKIINLSKIKSYETSQTKLTNYIKAETKQAISTLYQIGEKPVKNYSDYPKNKYEINNYLESLNWNLPWNAGAQFASLCVFSSIEKKQNEDVNTLIEFSNKIVNSSDGLYYSGSGTSKNELINGAMKVISGLDWIGQEIHYPEKLIETCLNSDINNEGCDVVDIIYVLYMCTNQLGYKDKKIINFLGDILEKIEQHYFSETGGFSYFKNKSQTHYYGIKISHGKNEPDIHGTVLFLWALSMILQILENSDFNFKTLKP